MLSWTLWYALGVMNVFALFFILQINVGIIPLLDAPVTMTPERIDKINALVSDLSQGVLISTLFFVLLVYVPARRKARQVELVYSYKVEWIIKYLRVIEFYLSERHGLYRDLSEDTDCDVVISTKSPFEFYWEFSDQVGLVFGTGGRTELDWLKSHINEIVKDVQYLLELPHITNEDVGLINVLVWLSRLNFFQTIISHPNLEEESEFRIHMSNVILRQFFAVFEALEAVHHLDVSLTTPENFKYSISLT